MITFVVSGIEGVCVEAAECAAYARSGVGNVAQLLERRIHLKLGLKLLLRMHGISVKHVVAGILQMLVVELRIEGHLLLVVALEAAFRLLEYLILSERQLLHLLLLLIVLQLLLLLLLVLLLKLLLVLHENSSQSIQSKAMATSMSLSIHLTKWIRDHPRFWQCPTQI